MDKFIHIITTTKKKGSPRAKRGEPRRDELFSSLLENRDRDDPSGAVQVERVTVQPRTDPERLAPYSDRTRRNIVVPLERNLLVEVSRSDDHGRSLKDSAQENSSSRVNDCLLERSELRRVPGRIDATRRYSGNSSTPPLTHTDNILEACDSFSPISGESIVPDRSLPICTRRGWSGF